MFFVVSGLVHSMLAQITVFSFFYGFINPVCPSVCQQISLDPPIKQGQTRYHFLILLFSKEEDISLTLNMSE